MTGSVRRRRWRATAERFGGGLELLQRRRLAHDLQVDDALAEGVELVAPDERMQRHAGLPRARADLADQLALERLLVEPALAGDDGAARAHARVEVQRVEHERGAGLSAAPCAAQRPPERPPALAVIGTPRGSLGRRRASSSRRRSSRSTIGGSAPFCGPKTRGAASNGSRTSQRTTSLAPPRPPASSIASSAPAPPSMVAEPPTATRITAAPARAAATISSPVP